MGCSQAGVDRSSPTVAATGPVLEDGAGSTGPARRKQAAAAPQPRPLTEEERWGAWHAANLHDSSSGHPHPIALWILGPSSVGKSTLTAKMGSTFGIPALGASPQLPAPERGPPSAEPAPVSQHVRRALDAVIVDGEFMRDAHALWRHWVQTEDWRSAYPALKAVINEEKDRLQRAAVEQRKHLVIPQTMLHLDKGLADIRRLASRGYTNHVLAVVASLAECQRRGRAREVDTGKRYQPQEFEQSIRAIPPVIAACNGQFQLIRAVERNEGSVQCMGHELLAAGPCGCSPAPEELNTPAPCFSADELSRVIANTVGVSAC